MGRARRSAARRECPGLTTAKVFIVDDEELARDRLARVIRGRRDMVLVGEAASVAKAVALIETTAPDILLLDIQLPGGDGFSILERLNEVPPAVIFVTAFDHHATRAFDAAAIDYVTKPIIPARLNLALSRAVKRLEDYSAIGQFKEMRETLAVLRREISEASNSESALWVRTHGQHRKLRARDLISLHAEGDYTRLVTADREYLYDERLSSVERLLPPADFVRLHRSAIAARSAIVSYKRGQFASLVALMTNGAEIKVGRSFAPLIREELGTARHARRKAPETACNINGETDEA